MMRKSYRHCIVLHGLLDCKNIHINFMLALNQRIFACNFAFAYTTLYAVNPVPWICCPKIQWKWKNHQPQRTGTGIRGNGIALEVGYRGFQVLLKTVPSYKSESLGCSKEFLEQIWCVPKIQLKCEMQYGTV